MQSKENIKNWIHNHPKEIRQHTVKLQDLPEDDPWVQDDVWDQVYKQTEQEGDSNGKEE